MLRRQGLEEHQRVVAVVDLAVPFAQGPGPAVVGGEKSQQVAVDAAPVQEMPDIALAQAQAERRVVEPGV